MPAAPPLILSLVHVLQQGRRPCHNAATSPLQLPATFPESCKKHEPHGEAGKAADAAVAVSYHNGGNEDGRDAGIITAAGIAAIRACQVAQNQSRRWRVCLCCRQYGLCLPYAAKAPHRRCCQVAVAVAAVTAAASCGNTRLLPDVSARRLEYFHL